MRDRLSDETVEAREARLSRGGTHSLMRLLKRERLGCNG